MTLSREVLAWSFSLFFVLGGMLNAPALADEAAEAGRQWRAGELVEAMAHADAFLTQHPRDLEMRFLKALILTEQSRIDEAVAIYSGLIDEFPALPESYNNLAVLLAAGGQYEKARSTFETATRIHPAFATAHENLGNIYAKMAIRSYGKVLQLDPASPGAKLKASTIHALIEDSSGDFSRQLALLPSLASVAPVQAQASPPAQPAPPEQIADATDAADYKDLMFAVESWSKAWNARDVDAYLRFYGRDFQTPDGEPRKKWEQKRRTRIQGKAYIKVNVEVQQVALRDQGAMVKFRQLYSSDRFTDESVKILKFAKQDGKWQIVQEYAGS